MTYNKLYNEKHNIDPFAYLYDNVSYDSYNSNESTTSYDSNESFDWSCPSESTQNK